ncbi:hypothetical protein [Psychrobacter sp. FDAARGOS_221]|uniref:hypothetical protein n=1 Tax=Psychrobacter sp. FDAARGOS_221 TaxID=1975705 RepID=UPI000BB58586|nr:hypothetical protein [Psychrobacter sp. FDAARGOS_221]PNK59502.1 hypothetical protein A6J60_000440 [Psychrobacter sp. FDAARGOS_221]
MNALIQKALPAICCLLLSNAAFAESQMDAMLKNAGVVDDNYVYTDPALVREAFKIVSNDYGKSLPVQMNSVVEVFAAMFTSRSAIIEYRITAPLDATEKQAFIEALTAPEAKQEACEDYFLSNEFMKANNYSLTYSYSDIDYRPLTKVFMNPMSCQY